METSQLPDCLCRTVGELLGSIAYLIERGETDTALRQARECAESYVDIALPEIDEDEFDQSEDADISDTCGQPVHDQTELDFHVCGESE